MVNQNIPQSTYTNGSVNGRRSRFKMYDLIIDGETFEIAINYFSLLPTTTLNPQIHMIYFMKINISNVYDVLSKYFYKAYRPTGLHGPLPSISVMETLD